MSKIPEHIICDNCRKKIDDCIEVNIYNNTILHFCGEKCLFEKVSKNKNWCELTGESISNDKEMYNG